MEFRIPKEYDKYLRHYYGEDYMTPPPEDKRITHDTTIVDICKPYTAYIEKENRNI